MTAFLLVHGAWHDERCWDSLVPELSAHGHAVHTLTLPGHWDRRLSPFRVSLKRYAKAVCEAADQINEPLTLVGHSMGGMVISKAAEMQPDLFNHMIYLAAYVPPLNRWTQVCRLTFGDRETQLWGALQVNWLKFSSTIDPDWATNIFYHDCAPDLADEATRRLCRQPGRPMVELMKVTQERIGSIPKTYIECRQDKVISPDLQRQMQTNMPFERVLSMDTSHSPFLSQPAHLADAMHRAVAHPKVTIEAIRPTFSTSPADEENASETFAGAL
ncbi:MAG: esterase [Rhodobiaceae bacterium]|nr:MAG: esterase [Rhodobiaceae bacterium]